LREVELELSEKLGLNRAWLVDGCLSVRLTLDRNLRQLRHVLPGLGVSVKRGILLECVLNHSDWHFRVNHDAIRSLELQIAPLPLDLNVAVGFTDWNFDGDYAHEYDVHLLLGSDSREKLGRHVDI